MNSNMMTVLMTHMMVGMMTNLMTDMNNMTETPVKMRDGFMHGTQLWFLWCPVLPVLPEPTWLRHASSNGGMRSRLGSTWPKHIDVRQEKTGKR